MRLFDLITISLGNLGRRQVRTMLTVLGVLIGTSSVVIMISLGVGMQQLNRELVESFGSLTEIQVHNFVDPYAVKKGETPNFMTDESIEKMKALPHVMWATPVLSTNLMLKQGKYESVGSVRGVSREYLNQIPIGEGSLPPEDTTEMFFVLGNRKIYDFMDRTKKGGYMGGMYGIYGMEVEEIPDVDYFNKTMFSIFDVDSYMAAVGGYSDENTPVAKKYIIKIAAVEGGDPGAYSNYSGSVFTDIELLKKQLKKVYGNKPIPGQPTNRKEKPYRYFIYEEAYVSVDKMENVKEVQAAISEMGFTPYANSEWLEQSEQSGRMMQAIFGGIGAVALFVAAIGIANTMMMSVYERTKEIGIMKVLGCDMGKIRDMFIMESAFIGLLGGVLGIGLSYLVSFIINRSGLSLVMFDYGEGGGNLSRIPFWLTFSALPFSSLVSVLAGFFPSLRAMNLSPLAALRNE